MVLATPTRSRDNVRSSQRLIESRVHGRNPSDQPAALPFSFSNASLVTNRKSDKTLEFVVSRGAEARI
ncbi:hypothetical protein CBOM_07507 [Ceraceosorus bombacis]|uniref:Uncharacterized protein n=1 Tax=Ceraceosorus bombacis TaxID=401625 RepID=A0A0P1BF80_9BASI|nr:hypothetical protein CBOM_07507 [Ceraceosorus bombacis]